jgi:3-phenylpropionate/trans-cinnamate dioxygenase ferredoxin reductase component
MTREQTYVIVGAGLAGAKAAETLRGRGFDGRIVLIGEEPARPYERPGLSKGYLTGESDAASLFTHAESFYPDQSIDLRTETAVTALDPADHTVTLGSGEQVRYDKALLATGSSPRRLSGPGAGLPGVFHLRTLADADALKAAASEAHAVAVIGAGWIGAEVTSSLRQRGLPVTLIEPASVPLERVLGTEVGAIYRDLHAGHGVDLRMGDGVASLHGDGQVEEVRTTSGARIDADLVVVGIGAQPRTGLAAEAGLKTGDGVSTDEYLRTSHPDVYAAGDIAAAWHPLFGTQVRVEHWANAADQGVAAGVTMLGADEPYAKIPYFFSDQYDLSMEYRGYCPDWDRVVLRGRPADGAFIAFWLRDGAIRAALNANDWDAGEHLHRLVQDRARIPVERLTDPAVALADLDPGSATRKSAA